MESPFISTEESKIGLSGFELSILVLDEFELFVKNGPRILSLLPNQIGWLRGFADSWSEKYANRPKDCERIVTLMLCEIPFTVPVDCKV